MPTLTAAVIVVSSEVAAGLREDRTGPVAVDVLAAHEVRAALQVTGDDPTAIAEAVRGAVVAGHRVVVTVGGTGIGPTDVTPAAVAGLLTYEIPGIAEEIRRRGVSTTAISLVSRGVAGVMVQPGRRSTFVVTVPGSRGGVRDAVGVVGPLLRYIIKQLDGDRH
ncbi:MAG: molybdenum cofactor biosynthesis protein B [Propioniciclava sp.]